MRAVSLLLSAALLFSLTACGGTEKPVEVIPSSETAAGPSASEPVPSAVPVETTPAPVPTAAPASESTGVTIQAGLPLMEWEGLTVTTRELKEDPIWGYELGVLIENNSDRTLGVGCDDPVVNHFMASTLFSETVAAGKKVNAAISLSGLSDAGITTIMDVVLKLHVFDPESYQTLYRAPAVTVPTSAAGSFIQQPPQGGRVLLEQDGVRISALNLEEGGFFGSSVKILVENQSGRDIDVRCDDLSVNGFMVDSFLVCPVDQGCMAVDEIDLMNGDLEENGIETIEQIELVFRVLDPSSYDTILETDPISFDLT